MWGFMPWDNDGAADWYGDLMDQTKLRDSWLEGIKQDPDESPDIVRAASGLFVMLGRVYIWPIDDYDEDLELTISQLQKVLENDSYQDVAELTDVIQGELSELKSRLKEPLSEHSPSTRPWWKLW